MKNKTLLEKLNTKIKRMSKFSKRCALKIERKKQGMTKIEKFKTFGEGRNSSKNLYSYLRQIFY